MPSEQPAQDYPPVAVSLGECCAGCGDALPELWMGGDWYCYSCASCDVCQSPYCEDPSHVW